MENITLSVTFNYKWFEFESSLRSILIDGSQLLLLSASTPIWLLVSLETSNEDRYLYCNSINYHEY